MICMDKEEDKEKFVECCQIVGDIWISLDNGWNFRYINSVKKEFRFNFIESEKFYLLFLYFEYIVYSVVDKISNNFYMEQFVLKLFICIFMRSEVFFD